MTCDAWTCVYAMYFLRQIANGSSHTGMLLKIEKWIWVRICHCTFVQVRTSGYILLQYRYENPNPNPNLMEKILILTPASRLIIFKTIPQSNINNQITMLTRLSVKTLSNHSTARVVAMRPFSIVNDLYKKVSI